MLKNKIILFLAAAALLVSATACLEGESDAYDAWREKNDEYVANIDTQEYTRLTTPWAPSNPVYIKWHNDRSLTAKNLVPLSTSTVNIKYEMEDIEGKDLGNSYSSTTYGDSVYQSMPKENIVGMWVTMTNMHVGDSVTVIIPYISAYGARSTSSFDPYTTLIYHMKLMKVVNYEKE